MKEKENDYYILRGGSWSNMTYSLNCAKREYAYIHGECETISFRLVFENRKIL